MFFNLQCKISKRFFSLLSTQGGEADYEKGQQSIFNEQNAKTSRNNKTIGIQVSIQQLWMFLKFFFLQFMKIN